MYELHHPFLLSPGCASQLFLHPLATHCVACKWGFPMEEGYSFTAVGFAPEVYTDVLILPAGSLCYPQTTSHIPEVTKLLQVWLCFLQGSVFSVPKVLFKDGSGVD